MLSNEKRNPNVTELFIRRGTFNIFLAFIKKLYYGLEKILDWIIHTIL